MWGRGASRDYMQSNGQVCVVSPAAALHVPSGAPPSHMPKPLPLPMPHAAQSFAVYGGVHIWNDVQNRQPICVAGSLQFSVLLPEPEPEPLPLPLLQSAGHEAPFSPFVVSHWPLPHELLLPPLLPLPQSAVQKPISLGEHVPSPHVFWLLPLPLPLPLPSSSPIVESAQANARAIARAQKIPDLILIMAGIVLGAVTRSTTK